MRHLAFLSILLFTLMPSTLMAEVIISEFLASNANGLTDEDDSNEDWIEIYNSGLNSVNLSSWALTDDDTQPGKWIFPNISIAANERLIVFASGKDRAVAGNELHTNFSLSASGEYLALIKPGGVKTSEFDPYPEQKSDVSYGLSSVSTTLANADTPLKYQLTLPLNDPQGDAWTEEDFDDTGWTATTMNGGNSVIATGGIGFDSNGQDSHLIDTTLPSGTSQAWVRFPFSLGSTPNFSGLTLRTIHDDGYECYLNGTLVHSDNAANPVQVTEPGETFTETDISQHLSLLKTGQNVLAFRLVNASSNSSDLILLSELIATDQSIQYLYNTTTTPGTANSGQTFQGFVEDTKFIFGRGIYDTALNETVTADTPGATIVYTTDGSEPTLSNGIQIPPADAQTNASAGIPITTTTTLRVAAFKAGSLPTNVDTQSYIFTTDVVTQSSNPAGWPTGPVNGQRLDYGMDAAGNIGSSNAEIKSALEEIPSISLVTDQENLLNTSSGIYVNPGNRGGNWERPASVEMIFPPGYTDPDGNTDGFGSSCGLRIRGGFSRTKNNAKHSFRLFFKDEYGDSSLDYKLFGNEGASSFKRIDFRTAQNYAWSLPSSNPGSKNTFIRDVLNRDAQRDLGRSYTRSRYFHLYLNGLYWGLYMTQERADSHYGESYLGGNDDDYDVVKSGGSSNGYRTEASSGELAGGAWEATWDLCKSVRDAASTNNVAYFNLQGRNSSGIIVPSQQNYLDVDSLIDYMLVVFYSGSRDSPLAFGNASNNWFGMRNRASNEHGFQFFMHDSEHSIDATNASDVTGPYSTGQSDALDRSNPQYIHEYLSYNNEYKLKFADRAHAALNNNGALSYANSISRIAAREATIDTAIIAESARWGDERSEGPYTRSDWVTAVDNVGNWLIGRESTIIGQFRADGLYPSIDAPSYSQHGGLITGGFQLSITNPNSQGITYFTTDGSDPRAVGGAVAGTTYSTAISIAKATVVKSRVRSNGEWSALTEARFSLGETPSDTNLVISEFSYQPNESSAGADDGDNFEFIEIMNIGNQPVDLSDLELTQAVTFDFATAPLADRTLAAGAYVVIVEDIASFQARYGNGIKILGKWTGKLSNSGETIRLGIKGGNTIQEFTYEDDLPWPTCADGEGFSLVLINPTSSPSHDNPSNWRCSQLSNGNPGGSDQEPTFAGNPNADNDGDGIPALIEHFLGSSENDASSGRERMAVGTIDVTEGSTTTTHLTLTFRHKLGLDDLISTVEASSTLAANNWLSGEAHALMISQVHENDGTVTETWRSIAPMSATAKLFMRLKVVQE